MHRLMKLWWLGLSFCMSGAGICIYISATSFNSILLSSAIILFSIGIIFLIKMMMDKEYKLTWLDDENAQRSRT